MGSIEYRRKTRESGISDKMRFAKSFLASVLGLLVISSNQRAQCYRILALFPVSGRSHFVMAESLMKGLASRGHRVDVVSHFPLDVSVPNYTDISLKGTLPISTNNVSIGFMDSYPFVSVERMVHAGGLAACSLLGHPKLREILRNPPTKPPYDLIIVEVTTFALRYSCDYALCRFIVNGTQRTRAPRGVRCIVI